MTPRVTYMSVPLMAGAAQQTTAIIHKIVSLPLRQVFFCVLPPTRNDRPFCDNFVTWDPMRSVAQIKVWELTDLMRYQLWL